MKRKHLSLIILTLIISAFCLIGLVACGDNGSSGTKTITISIDESAEVGAPVKLEKSASFSPFLQDKIMYEFVGENSCDAQFSHTLDNKKNWWDTFVIASKSGSASIKLSYIEDGEVVAESNTVSISFYANTISSVEEFKAISGTTKSYELTCDIDLGNANWIPFDFSGNFSGAGHTIKNFIIDAKSDNIGLFAKLTGNVYDLNIVDATIKTKSKQTNIGILAGVSNGQISNCSVSGTIEAPSSSYVGGIAGKVENKGIITNSKCNADITASEYVGGIAGYIVLPTNGELKGNTNTNTVTGTTYVGGIAGYLGAESSYNNVTFNVENNVNEGEITGTSNVGGLFGEAHGYQSSYKVSYGNYNYYYGNIELISCTNEGEVKASGEKIGGLIGTATYVSAITESKNLADITGGNYVGGYLGGYSGGGTLTITGARNENTITGLAYLGGIVGSGANLSSCENSGSVIAKRATTDGYTYIGGLAGTCGTVDSCKNEVDITGTGMYVGGLAGKCTSITDSENYGEITGNSKYVGGLAGWAESVNGSTNNGEVTGGAEYTGGLVGYVYSNLTSFESNRNLATVEGRDYTGGLVGYLSMSELMVYSCENLANITGGNYTGGLAGYISNGATINGYINSNTITGKAYVGGIVGCGASTKLAECENNGTIVTTNTITESNVNCSYVGGLAGKCSDASNCKNTVDITAKGAYTGGIAGYMVMPKGTSLNENTNRGKITGTTYVGGIAGYLGAESSYNNVTFNVENNVNEGEITGTSNVGGLFGEAHGYQSSYKVSYGNYNYYYGYIELIGCTNKGNVKASGEKIGGLIGTATYVSAITGSKNLAKVTGGNNTNELVGYSSDNILYQ